MYHMYVLYVSYVLSYVCMYCMYVSYVCVCVYVFTYILFNLMIHSSHLYESELF